MPAQSEHLLGNLQPCQGITDQQISLVISLVYLRRSLRVLEKRLFKHWLSVGKSALQGA